MAEIQSRDLVLTPGEQAFMLDTNKGVVSVNVGPHKTPMSDNDVPVQWERASRRFVRVDKDRAIHPFPSAGEGYYIILENPAVDEREQHPREGASNTSPALRFGQRVNIPGPITFPLWPRQYAEVVAGHHLRSNQYLVVRVYNELEAIENWGRAVVRPQTTDDPNITATDRVGPAQPIKASSINRPDTLTMGQLLIIRGTDVSFYIPPTGIEVLKAGNEYVREAVTLEQLEYAILISEDGTKRYVKGPDVVFPTPTEKFVEKGEARKFRAIELNEISGIHVKVVAPYEDRASGRIYQAGEELFIRGSDQAIYYPRDEHAIIKYDQQPIHYATAVPAGEGRYVLNRLTGEVRTVRGPVMLLPDPRQEVIVRRVLDEKAVELWFPGNTKAIEINKALRQEAAGSTEPLRARGQTQVVRQSLSYASQTPVTAAAFSAGEFLAEEIDRKSGYTPPRTITLDTKYEGAVLIDIWTGYAVQISNRQGERRVVVGPQAVLLEYDESLTGMALSTGKPKTTDNIFKTAYLRVMHNRVSDIVTVETKDLVQIEAKLSYRVNFEGEPSKWFDVENYVKHLTDHLRSLLRNMAKRHGVEEFYAKSTDLIRDAILGAAAANGTERTGRMFKENGMRVYDVEVLGVTIKDATIAGLLVKYQQEVVKSTLEAEAEERRRDITSRIELARRETAMSLNDTKLHTIQLQIQETEKALQLTLQRVASQAEQTKHQNEYMLREQEILTQISTKTNERTLAAAETEAAAAVKRIDAELLRLRTGTEEIVKRAQAITPDMIAALTIFQNTDMLEKITKAVAPLSIIGGNSVVDVVRNLFRDTPISALVDKISTAPTNGARETASV